MLLGFIFSLQTFASFVDNGAHKKTTADISLKILTEIPIRIPHIPTSGFPNSSSKAQLMFTRQILIMPWLGSHLFVWKMVIPPMFILINTK